MMMKEIETTLIEKKSHLMKMEVSTTMAHLMTTTICLIKTILDRENQLQMKMRFFDRTEHRKKSLQ